MVWTQKKSMYDEKVPVKVKNFIFDGLKKGRLQKRWKEITKKTCWLEI